MKKQKVKGYGTSNKNVTAKDVFSVIGLCVLCIFLVGASLIFTRSKNDAVSNKTKTVQETQDDFNEDIKEVYIEESDEAEVENLELTENNSDEIIEIIDEEEIYETEPITVSNEKAVEMVLPLQGEILKPFSDKELLYSKTLDDWRIHRGIDIKAQIGTTVCVCADGVVEYAGEDIRYGHTIIVSHNDGFKSVYSNLTGTEMVKIGKDLKKGDPIGMVGDSAIVETSDEAHLHFEFLYNDFYVDPSKFFDI